MSEQLIQTIIPAIYLIIGAGLSVVGTIITYHLQEKSKHKASKREKLEQLSRNLTHLSIMYGKIIAYIEFLDKEIYAEKMYANIEDENKLRLDLLTQVKMVIYLYFKEMKSSFDEMNKIADSIDMLFATYINDKVYSFEAIKTIISDEIKNNNVNTYKEKFIAIDKIINELHHKIETAAQKL
ncbi:MAG: hypothetical protein FWE37_02750 [Spirochaetaceae bacterium]|nr:hypothetical protein [Spirochaetaceae bacterium]